MKFAPAVVPAVDGAAGGAAFAQSTLMRAAAGSGSVKAAVSVEAIFAEARLPLVSGPAMKKG